MTLSKKVHSYILENHLLNGNGEILVALSGGADSIVLVLILKDLGYPLHALHCNFHLRGEESDRDQRFVEDFCQKENIKVEVVHFNTRQIAEERGISIEMAARDLRYEWFLQKIHTLQARCITVAHHANDQAETLLLNLIRGTGMRGLCGMWPKNGEIERPLLCCTREEILQYLSDKSQDYVIDSTNLEREARRNVLRLDVFPMLAKINPQIQQTLAKTAERIQQSLAYYETGIEEAIDRISENAGKINLRKLKNEVMPQTLLHEWLKGKGFNESQEKDILKDMDNGKSAVFLSNSYRLLRDRGFLICEEIADECFSEQRIEVPGVTILTEQYLIKTSLHNNTANLPRTNDYAWVDYDKIKYDLKIRKVAEGDSFIPFGMNGRKLVSDFLTDVKANLFEKEKQLVITHGQDIIWVVGRRSDNRYKVTPKTKRILLLQYTKN